MTEWDEVFVNPKIVYRDCFDKTPARREGCLSLPGVAIYKPRYLRIRLDDGRMYEDLKAIVVQHELDHLNGILLTDEVQHAPPPDLIHKAEKVDR